MGHVPSRITAPNAARYDPRVCTPEPVRLSRGRCAVRTARRRLLSDAALPLGWAADPVCAPTRRRRRPVRGGGTKRDSGEPEVT